MDKNWSAEINPFKLWPFQTAQAQLRGHRTRHLFGVWTVCSQNFYVNNLESSTQETDLSIDINGKDCWEWHIV